MGFLYWLVQLDYRSCSDLFLFGEARNIRNSFLRRVRLPEVIKELVAANRKLSKHLKNWDEEARKGGHQLPIAKELIESLKPKLPSFEKKKCSGYVQKLQTRTFFIFKFESSVVDCRVLASPAIAGSDTIMILLI